MATNSTANPIEQNGSYRNQPAQRLWLLERPAALSPDIFRFAAAVAVLDGACVYIVIVKCTEPSCADETALQRGRLRQLFERSAARFGGLDQALRWADAAKLQWMTRGWCETTVSGR